MVGSIKNSCAALRLPAAGLGVLIATSGLLTAQGPETAGISAWTVRFNSSKQDRPATSAAVVIGGTKMLVFVAAAGADLASVELHHESEMMVAKLAGYDPVTGLGFLMAPTTVDVPSLEWLPSTSISPDMVLTTPLSGTVTASAAFSGRVKSINGKILPLALLQFEFNGEMPLPGTPLLDSQNRVAALFFQADPNRSGYALPVEAVHRVRRDIAESGKFTRAWIGLSMQASNKQARVVRVIEKSPASAAGIQPDDLLLSVGNRMVRDYADAVDAFFYLVPGQDVELKLMRGASSQSVTLTPISELP